MPFEILMPSLDPSTKEAMVIKWLKTEGDPVSIGDPIVEIEADKAVVEVEAERNGSFGKPLVEEGDSAPVNSVIGLILTEGEENSPLQKSPTKQASTERSIVSDSLERNPPPASDDKNLPSQENSLIQGERIFASPLARRLAALKGLKLSQIRGSGPNGRIVKTDIERFQALPSVQHDTLQRQDASLVADFSCLPDFEEISNTRMRKTIARRLTEASQQIPHYFLSLDCELDKLIALRQEFNETYPKEPKISLNDFFVQAVALALKKVPEVNVAWTDSAILRFNRIDISFAVAIEGGLITPVVKDVGGKSLSQISAETTQLAEKARAGRLRPDEYKGGTFTLSNLGMFGIKSFTSIINAPQSAILSIGAAQARPVIKNGQVCAATVMTVTLAVDHRCIDGAFGAKFLAAFKRLIEVPLSLLLEGPKS